VTIAICLKVSDVLVFSADSAATVWDSAGPRVYTNAEKIICLHKELPLGMMVYGLGGIAGRSITSLAKDLRKRFTAPDDAHREWKLDPENFSIEDVANRVREYFYDELYVDDVIPLVNAYYDELEVAAAKEAKEKGEDPPEPATREFPVLGIILGGIASGEAKSEVWEIVVDDKGNCADPKQLCATDDDGTVYWRGVEEPLARLLMGINSSAWSALSDQGIASDDIGALLVDWAPLAHSAMPIQDAIDLADYLADVAAGYLRFSAGPDVVAPPIDLAAITAHERFKWVRRKHYYPPELNP
jgi:hypothetical protein